MTPYDNAKFYGYNSVEEYYEAQKRDNEIFFKDLEKQKSYTEKESVKIQPVVHCKDCKYAQNPNDSMIYCTYFECGTMSQNDFCSQGEGAVKKVEYIDKEATIDALDSRDGYDDLVNTIREQPAANV